MKIIVTHDVDHLSVNEHIFNDLYIEKLILRDLIQLLTNKITITEYNLRIKELLKNKISYLKELCEFNLKNNIPANFFLASKKGRSLSYSNKQLDDALKLLKSYENTHCYLHGIKNETKEKIIEEKLIFEKHLKTKNTGIRMHYLAKNNFFKNLSKTGYIFDSSFYEIKNPYRVDGIVEFPITFMDVYDVPLVKYNKQNFEFIKNETLKKIEYCNKIGLKYLVIDFHDRYFSKAYCNYFNWYKFLIQYLKNKKFSFTSFSEIEMNKI